MEFNKEANPWNAAIITAIATTTKDIGITTASNIPSLPDSSHDIDEYTDPFAHREGETLAWRNVNMILSGKRRNDPDRYILHDVWGEIPAKETTAILGPSGSGKTSLLNVLSGRVRSHGRIRCTSDIRLNNYAVDPTRIEIRHHIAFVDQDNSLYKTATPREAIRFSAKLRLSRYMTNHKLDQLTTRVVTELGLTECADTVIGGVLVSGISGGERKRTAVGIELVTKPSLIYLDEPTSGLDSFSAVQLCQVLRKVANAGATVMFTIHQPSSEILNSFDRLILLNRGRIMYQGPVRGVPQFFEVRGDPVPPNYNPADWIMQIAQTATDEELEETGFFPADDRNLGESLHLENGQLPFDLNHNNKKKHRKSIIAAVAGAPSSSSDKSPPPILSQIAVLFHREMINLRRDTHAVAARFGLTNFMSLLAGTIFFNIGSKNSSNQEYLQSHFGALMMITLMSIFSTAQPSLLAFPDERPVFLREYSTNHYSVIGYFVSRFTVEAVITALQILNMLIITYFMINFQGEFAMLWCTVYTLAMASTALAVLLGCAVDDPKLAKEMTPVLFMPQILFSGFFVRPSLIPVWLRWAQYVCPLTYALRLVMVVEFKNCGNFLAQIHCDTLLVDVYANPDDTWWYWTVLVALFLVFRITALLTLRSKASKYF